MTEFISADEFESRLDDDELDNVTEYYRDLRDDEGIPVHTGVYVEDVNDLEVGNWDRTGQKGAFVNLYGNQGVNDMQIQVVEPGGETKVQRHMYDELVYVSQGQGLTAIGDEDDEHVFEWQDHSMFYLPPNVKFKYVNTSDEPARLISQTPLPQLCNIYKNPDFFFDCDYEYLDVGPDYYSDGNLFHTDRYPVWEANFVPDLRKFDKLEDRPDRGAGGSNAHFSLPDASLFAHMSEFPVGRYKLAHRHQPGANIIVLSGEGYSLLWEEEMDVRVKVDWKPFSAVVPPANWYHQHFNTSTDSARYLALRAPALGTLKERIFDSNAIHNKIPYVDEDPAIRELFAEELAEVGLESRMPKEVYTNSDYEF